MQGRFCGLVCACCSGHSGDSVRIRWLCFRDVPCLPTLPVFGSPQDEESDASIIFNITHQTVAGRVAVNASTAIKAALVAAGTCFASANFSRLQDTHIKYYSI